MRVAIIAASGARRGTLIRYNVHTPLARDGDATDSPFHPGRPGDRCDPDMSLPEGILFSRVDGVDAFTTVQFHPESHIPETDLFDEPGVADEEYNISLPEFEVLNSPPASLKSLGRGTRDL
jgi:hypothetical protein